MRGMVATVALTGLLAAALAATVVTTATAQDAEGGDAPATASSPEALVDRLVEIERDLPELPPTGAVSDDELAREQLQGDFLGALTELDLVADQARQLFIDADEADGPVAEAVALVARGYLRLREGYQYLSRYEDYDLDRPLAATDENGVATGADDPSGLVEPGLDLVDLARSDALLGYSLLRDTESADDAEKGLFDAAYRDTQTYLTQVRPLVHPLAASRTAVLVVVDRFDGPPSEARAKHVTYVCIPRELYPADSPDPRVALAALLASEELDLVPTADCPALPNEANLVTTQAR